MSYSKQASQAMLRKAKEKLQSAKDNFKSDKVTIDLKQCTIRIDDPYDVSDLLDTRHVISKERAKELLEHIKEA